MSRAAISISLEGMIMKNDCLLEEIFKIVKEKMLNHFPYFLPRTYYVPDTGLVLRTKDAMNVGPPLKSKSSKRRYRQIKNATQQTVSVVSCDKCFHKDVCGMPWYNRGKTSLWQWCELGAEVAVGWERKRRGRSGKGKIKGERKTIKRKGTNPTSVLYVLWHLVCFVAIFRPFWFCFKEMEWLCDSLRCHWIMCNVKSVFLE